MSYWVSASGTGWISRQPPSKASVIRDGSAGRDGAVMPGNESLCPLPEQSSKAWALLFRLPQVYLIPVRDGLAACQGPTPRGAAIKGFALHAGTCR